MNFCYKNKKCTAKGILPNKNSEISPKNDISCKTLIYFSTENFLWNFCLINRIPNFVGILYNQIDVGWSQNVSLPISISHYVKTI